MANAMAIKFSNLVDFNKSFVKWDYETPYHLWFMKYYLTLLSFTLQTTVVISKIKKIS